MGNRLCGPIKPPAKGSHVKYTIVATDYLTKWVEAKATIRSDTRTTTRFLYEYVFVHYGLPIELVSDQGKHFINEVIEYLLGEFMVIHRKLAPYHLQTNGRAESTNKVLCTALIKVVEGSRSDWESKLHSVPWAYQTGYKTSIGTTPFNLVFGLDAILPIKFLVPTLTSLDWNGHEFLARVEQLERLDETKLHAVAAMYAKKRHQKCWHDNNIRSKEFQLGDLVLLYTLKKQKRKLKMQGLGPFVINEITTGGVICLETLDGEPMATFINASRLKRFHKPLTNLLEHMHATKHKKLALQTLKDDAQAEAKVRNGQDQSTQTVDLNG